MMIFLAYYFYWRIHSERKAKHIERENILIGDYSVYVTNIPEKGITSFELKTYFAKKFGPIVECTMAKKYNGHLFDFQKLSDIYNLFQYEEYAL